MSAVENYRVYISDADKVFQEVTLDSYKSKVTFQIAYENDIIIKMWSSASLRLHPLVIHFLLFYHSNNLIAPSCHLL